MADEVVKDPVVCFYERRQLRLAEIGRVGEPVAAGAVAETRSYRWHVAYGAISSGGRHGYEDLRAGFLKDAAFIRPVGMVSRKSI
jgi:hypothetical protein